MSQDYENDDIYDGNDSGHRHTCDDPNEPYSWFELPAQGGTTGDQSTGGGSRRNYTHRYRGDKNLGGGGGGCLLLIALPIAAASAIFYGFGLFR